MPMVPGLATNMPSRISFDEDPISNIFEDNYVPLDLDPDFFHALSASDIIGPLSTLSDSDEIFSAGPMLPTHEVKRECMFGKPLDLCLRECGQDCDPFSRYYEVRRCGCGSNMAISHCCDHYKMVNPQSVLPIQLPVHSILNDHSYHQSISYPDSEMKQACSYESESQSDSAEEIDVETIHEKVEPPVKVVKRRGRKPAQKLKPSNSKTAINRRTIAKKNRNVQHGRPAKGQKWSRASREPSSASSSDAEECGKRSNHNDMERLRRDHQKTMLQEVRVLVPSIKHNTKAPKVMILNEAAKYCTQLTYQCEQYESIKAAHLEKNKELQRRISKLRKQLKLQ